MKKIVIYTILLAAALLIPVKGTDVGKLVPVEVIQIYKEGDVGGIATDLGESGVGTSVKEAVENLKATTSGIIFMDTADFLLIDVNAKEEAIVLKDYLKPSVRVCFLDGEIDLEKTAAFLNVHRPATKLENYGQEELKDILTTENERMILKEK